MALNFNDPLARILDDTTPNRRLDIWRWIYLTNSNIPLPEDINQPGMRSTIAHVISNTLGFTEVIKDKEAKQLLPEKC